MFQLSGPSSQTSPTPPPLPLPTVHGAVDQPGTSSLRRQPWPPHFMSSISLGVTAGWAQAPQVLPDWPLTGSQRRSQLWCPQYLPGPRPHGSVSGHLPSTTFVDV